MKRTSLVCQLALVALVGCAPPPTASDAPTDGSNSSAVDNSAQPNTTAQTTKPTEDSSGLTLVSLNVPNMH